MGHLLQNQNLELYIDSPGEHYVGARFDWTGKICRVKYRGIPVTTVESLDAEKADEYGKGFYNEFGIDTALGYEEAKPGEWFHKIGVGLLKKEEGPYLFSHRYTIDPAHFEVTNHPEHVHFICRSKKVNGYAYVLEKVIKLDTHGFDLHYNLQNTGENDLKTTEYLHNFVAVNDDPVGSHYHLKFPFNLEPALFQESVNPEEIVMVSHSDITFSGTPAQQFFFSHLNGGQPVEARWELINRQQRMALVETTNFPASKVNLWGWKQVISPELFIELDIPPGEAMDWTRRYRISILKD